MASNTSSSAMTILGSLEWIRRFTFLRPSAIGNFLEPALTSANTIVQTILGPPFFWRWNRVVTGFVTKVGQQDYTIFNWKSGFAVNTQYVLVDSNGNSQAVTTAGVTGAAIPSFNPTKGDTTAENQFVLSAVANASAGTTVYTGTIAVPVGSLVGLTFIVTGFDNAANNGTFVVTANNGSTTITLANTAGVADSHAGLMTAVGGAVWTNMGSINTPVSTTYNFAWMETISLQVTNAQSGAITWKEISPKITIALEEQIARPNFIAAQLDNGNGDITFRLMPVPDQVYPVAITVQEQPPVYTAANGGVNQTWAPIPDEYSMIYNWGMLALMLLYADDPRFQMANNKFIASLLSTHQGLTDTERNIWLNNWQALSGTQIMYATNNQQATQVRTAI